MKRLSYPALAFVISILIVLGFLITLLFVPASAAFTNYTNLVPTSIDSNGYIFNGSGYMENYRLSSSGGTSSQSGAVVSGFIPYSVNGVIRVLGSTSSTTTSGQYVNFYDSSFNLVKSVAFKYFAEGYGYYTQRDDGLYLLTANDVSRFFSVNFSTVDVSTIKYIRVSALACSSDDFVVTINEEIKPIHSYYVSIDGSGFHYDTTADSITLNLIVNANNYIISVDGSEVDYYISDTVLNNSVQRFVGLGPQNILDQVNYGIGSYEIVLTSSSPQLLFDTIYEYPLYIDPNGGTWNGSTSTSVFWELANTDTDEIYDPVRPGYTFSGWTFSGVGEFNDAGDPPHIFEHDTGAGYLTANWVSIPVYTHTISIDGSSYAFTAENAAPPVTILVTSTGFTMSSGNVSEDWTYSGPGTFLGLEDSSGNKYDIGANFSLLGLSGSDKTSVLTPIVKNEYIIVSGLWECNSQLMTGEYLDLSAWPEGLSSVDISFMSSGVSFYQISYRYDLSQGYSIFYGNNLAYSYGLADDPAWLSNNYTKLYFESDQSVPQAFFDWFNSNFKRIGDDPVDPVYTVSINVYDNSGSVLHGTYSLSAPSVSPVLTLSVSAGGLQLSSSEDVVWSWAHNEEVFYGFALSDGSSSAVYVPGQTYTLPGGEPYDLVVSLFVVNKDVNEGQYRVGVFGWLERLYDKICELVERSGIFPDVSASLKIVDFSSIGSFFTDMYNQVTSLFGLRTLIEDPAGPFAWLLDT